MLSGKTRPLSRGASLNRKEVTPGIYGRGRSCPAIPRSGGAGLHVEEKASRLPWMGRLPPLSRGGKIGPGKVLPPSTIQTNLARSSVAVRIARVLLPAEDPLMQVQMRGTVESTKTCAFIRLASERCRSIIFALPDSGNLCRADIISVATFRALNKCAIRKLVLEPCGASSDIRSVTGSSLRIVGRIRGGGLKFIFRVLRVLFI